MDVDAELAAALSAEGARPVTIRQWVAQHSWTQFRDKEAQVGGAVLSCIGCAVLCFAVLSCIGCAVRCCACCTVLCCAAWWCLMYCGVWCAVLCCAVVVCCGVV